MSLLPLGDLPRGAQIRTPGKTSALASTKVWLALQAPNVHRRFTTAPLRRVSAVSRTVWTRRVRASTRRVHEHDFAHLSSRIPRRQRSRRSGHRHRRQPRSHRRAGVRRQPIAPGLRPAGPRPAGPARPAGGASPTGSSPRPVSTTLESGEPTPSDADGTGCFRGRHGGTPGQQPRDRRRRGLTACPRCRA